MLKNKIRAVIRYRESSSSRTSGKLISVELSDIEKGVVSPGKPAGRSVGRSPGDIPMDPENVPSGVPLAEAPERRPINLAGGDGRLYEPTTSWKRAASRRKEAIERGGVFRVSYIR